MFSQIDARHMASALKLAEQGRYTTSPNPNVGCVLVAENGDIISEGFHLKAGGPHAEAEALNKANNRARGATAYVTLEPCSHHGRTPPCSDALIKAGVRRVVVAMQDPNPKVAGNGIKKMRDAGIQVDIGLMETQATALNKGFFKRQLQGLPRVTLKMAASLDAKTALSNGVSQWITGTAARRDVQEHRARSCAIVSGSGTVLADNPALTIRADELPGSVQQQYPGDIRQPLRVILDGRNQLHPALKVFADNRVLVVNRQPNPLLTQAGIEQWQAPTSADKIDLQAVLTCLAQRQINDVWLEVGSRLGGAFVQANLVDELIVYLAPKLMGSAGFSLLQLPEFKSMDQVPEMRFSDTRMVGEDLKITAHFV